MTIIIIIITIDNQNVYNHQFDNLNQIICLIILISIFSLWYLTNKILFFQHYSIKTFNLK